MESGGDSRCLKDRSSETIVEGKKGDSDEQETVARVPRDELDREPRARGDTDSLTHEELLKLTSSTLGSLLQEDELLSDLPADVTVEEVAAQIAVMQGQSIRVSVMQDDGQHLNVVVAQNGTVTDLKRAVQRHVNLKLKRAGRGQVKVNWRYMWRTNWLALADGTKLTQGHVTLTDAGIGNRSKLKYIKRLREKQLPECV